MGLCKEPLGQDVGIPRAFTAKKEAYAPVTASQPTAIGIAAGYAQWSKPSSPWRYFLEDGCRTLGQGHSL